jgi:hypothetical protein
VLLLSVHRQLLLGLAEWLCANYDKDSHAKRIVQNMHLFILPTMNPDGFQKKTRGNAKHVSTQSIQQHVKEPACGSNPALI